MCEYVSLKLYTYQRHNLSLLTSIGSIPNHLPTPPVTYTYVYIPIYPMEHTLDQYTHHPLAYHTIHLPQILMDVNQNNLVWQLHPVQLDMPCIQSDHHARRLVMFLTRLLSRVHSMLVELVVVDLRIYSVDSLFY